jgi:hypothetical protein
MTLMGILLASTLALAQSLLAQAQSGQFDRSALTATMSSELTQDQAAQLSARMAPLGKPSSFALETKQVKGDLTKYVYRVAFAGVTFEEDIVLERSGKVAGLWFRPAPVTPAAGDAPALALAKTLLRQAQTGRFDRSLLSAQLSSDLSSATVKDIAGQLAPLGAPASFKLQSRQRKNDLTVYLYRVLFTDGAYLEELAVDGSGKVAVLWFKPAS